CRTCKRPISWRHPIIELLTGILLVGYVARFGIIINFDWLFLLVAVFGFFLLGLFDFYYLILPDKLVFPMIALAFLRIFFYGNQSRLIDLGIGLLLMSFFAILYLVSRGKWLGFGDVKLVLCIGILFGYPGAILILLFSVWIASLVGLLIIILKRGSLKTALPFGSFLCFISIIFILFREQLSFIIQIFS
ncbi:MAG TPA: prepilin peptidase, partial [Candidatus Paceibacterota bacterium]|nr:prepilin peptidase [Candidatus Paceibacterota bacterium]